MRFFLIRFRRLSTFCLFFAETPTLTIFMAILCQAIMANFSKIAIMAILVWVDVAINMVNMGVSAKNRQNVDSLRKRIGKNRIGKKVMTKTKYFVQKGSKMADFLCIFVWNLKWMANGLGNKRFYKLLFFHDTLSSSAILTLFP